MGDDTMLRFKLARPVLVALAACIASSTIGTAVFADDAKDNAQLKEQMRIMMQQMQELQKQVQELKRQQQAPTVAAPPPAPPPAGAPPTAAPPAQVAKGQGPSTPAAPAEPKFEKILKGFYGTLDVSFDDTTKGIRGLTAYPWSFVNPANPNSGYVRGATPKAGPVGSVGYIGSLSTNKSVLGYRGSHKIDGSNFDFIYQIETQPAITSAPGLSTSYTAQSNVVKAGIGYGDSFVGIQNNTWGKLKIGTTYSPYKKSTDRLNPFSGMLGDYSVIVGNTGGDNRVEFGTRLDHSIWYESPKLVNGTLSFDVLVSPGANRTYDNVVQSAGSPDCSGGNTPGSGNLPENCDDGGFGTAYSADLKFEFGGLYATAAWELHHKVNRNSDGIGSNSPYYGYLVGLTNGANGPCSNPGAAPVLDCGTFNTYNTEYGPQFAATNGFSPPYLTDIADEWAIKTGLQYVFSFGLSVSGLYEYLHRSVPADLEFQNERQRNGLWLAASWDIEPRDNVSIGWGHAGRTPGDPGGQHNYDPTTTQNYANLFTAAWKHRFDKSLYWYIDAADTINHGNAHYDIGAGGRGVTTDCHDGTNTVFTDYSSAGPTTWGGCHLIGFSTGLNYKF
jgi:predicted porin